MGYGYGYGGYGGYGRGLSLFRLGGAYIAGFVIGFIALWVIIALVRWKIFEKGGEAGWKSLIPIYGDYIEWKIVWKGKWFWFMLLGIVAAWIGILIPVIGFTITIAAILFVLVVNTFFYLQYAHAFGRDDGFGLGLMFIGFVFKIMLAFDADNQYKGAQPDPKIFGKIGEQSAEAAAAARARKAEFEAQRAAAKAEAARKAAAEAEAAAQAAAQAKAAEEAAAQAQAVAETAQAQVATEAAETVAEVTEVAEKTEG